MKKSMVLALMVIVLGVDISCAQEPATTAVAVVEVGNKICPVSKESVGAMGEEIIKYEYKGKLYNLCCAMCKKDFSKDPDKYSKIADDEVAQEKAM